jgi:hypothetical protein
LVTRTFLRGVSSADMATNNHDLGHKPGETTLTATGTSPTEIDRQYDKFMALLAMSRNTLLYLKEALEGLDREERDKITTHKV